MHYARLDKSARLQRVLGLLADGAEHTTMEIIHGAGVANVSAPISELRANGCDIACRQSGAGEARVAYYRLLAGPAEAPQP